VGDLVQLLEVLYGQVHGRQSLDGEDCDSVGVSLVVRAARAAQSMAEATDSVAVYVVHAVYQCAQCMADDLVYVELQG
jgi:hypothetical protein